MENRLLNPAESSNPYYMLEKRNPRHRQMIAVLERYELGNEDAHGRGWWVTKGACLKAAEIIRRHPRGYVESFGGGHVFPEDFDNIFQTGDRRHDNKR